jgi:hypothetical protein
VDPSDFSALTAVTRRTVSGLGINIESGSGGPPEFTLKPVFSKNSRISEIKKTKTNWIFVPHWDINKVFVKSGLNFQ